MSAVLSMETATITREIATLTSPELEKLKADMTGYAKALVELSLQNPQLMFAIGSQLLLLGGAPRSFLIDRAKEAGLEWRHLI